MGIVTWWTESKKCSCSSVFTHFKGTVEKNGDLGKPLVAATAFFDERKEMPVVLRNP